MKYTTLLFLLAFTTAGAFAADVISQQRFVRIMPIYQRWDLQQNNQFSEVSFPLQVYLPLSRNLSATLLGSQASVSGEALQSLSGLTDTQLSFNYHLEGPKLMLSLGINLPSGKTELTQDEFVTSNVISLNILNLQVPNFGQGWNISPGLTWAVPVQENFVLGLGAAYQYKGAFKPLTGLSADYNPGDEILLTGGFDLRLSPTAVFTSDVIFTLYGTDNYADSEVFTAGNKLVANFQFRQYFDYDELWLLARYRSRGKNDVAVAGQLVTESVKTSPNQIEVLGHYRRRFSRQVSVRFLAEGRFYQETPAFEGVNLFGGGLAPIISLSPSFQLLAQFKYFTGSFKSGDSLSGVEAGLGAVVNF
ncbi:MAG: hypothetical protein ONA90_11635 [candidate division KSB1 bacterium]|nr:hypothetical protein [candidate division KSB1 bacterium]